MNTAKLYLGRHCKTEWNLERKLIGSTDLPLCEFGWNEAKETLPLVEAYGFDRIVTSPLQRAHQTSKYYADNLGIPLDVHEGLRELDHGDWNGQKYDDLLADPSSRFKEWFIEGDVSIPIPSAPETLEEVQERIKKAVKEIALAYPGEKVLVVMHKHIRSLLTCYLRGEPVQLQEEYRRSRRAHRIPRRRPGEASLRLRSVAVHIVLLWRKA
ncbi:MAG: histidine phosphatase family protein [Thermodesulfobacteriota bacterium]